jgi:hypothetical protein
MDSLDKRRRGALRGPMEQQGHDRGLGQPALVTPVRTGLQRCLGTLHLADADQHAGRGCRMCGEHCASPRGDRFIITIHGGNVRLMLMNYAPTLRRNQVIAPFGVGAIHVLKGSRAVVTAGLDYWFKEATRATPCCPGGGIAAPKPFRSEPFPVAARTRNGIARGSYIGGSPFPLSDLVYLSPLPPDGAKKFDHRWRCFMSEFLVRRGDYAPDELCRGLRSWTSSGFSLDGMGAP